MTASGSSDDQSKGLGDAHAEGATPLDPDEVQGLIPRHITMQGQLNEWEEANIAEAEAWLRKPRTQARWPNALTEAYALELHRRMFDHTWRWAGTLRKTEKNIGVDPGQVAVRLRQLLDDTHYWLAHGTYDLPESVTRFHHRLVAIHPFANGNGRHARLMSDVLLMRNGAARFSWGGRDLGRIGDVRARYLLALREADAGCYTNLLAFVIS